MRMVKPLVRFCASLFLLSILTACESSGTKDNLAAVIAPVNFSDLHGWNEDRHAKAFALFTKNCSVNAKRERYFTSITGTKVASDSAWRRACMGAQNLEAPTDEEARVFFEQNFHPYRVTTQASSKGLTTGYYEPLLHGSYKKSARYFVPVYGVPYRFSKPSFSRAQIEAGALNGKAPILLYVDDPVMLFFLHIQGSGKVRMEDGALVGLQYAQQNGHGYVPIGRMMRDEGLLETVSMQTIRDWLRSHPSQAQAVMNTNPSYIFFTLSHGVEAAKGAMGIPLTANRSLAVDDERVPYGLPIYLQTTVSHFGTGEEKHFAHLMGAQDTGGAIIGATRYDIFFGRGAHAEWKAGHQNAKAKVFWLLPAEY